MPNEKSASVSVIDTATDQRLRDLPLGERPRGIAAGGGLLYLTGALVMAYNVWRTILGHERSERPVGMPAAART